MNEAKHSHVTAIQADPHPCCDPATLEYKAARAAFDEATTAYARATAAYDKATTIFKAARAAYLASQANASPHDCDPAPADDTDDYKSAREAFEKACSADDGFQP